MNTNPKNNPHPSLGGRYYRQPDGSLSQQAPQDNQQETTPNKTPDKTDKKGSK